MTRYKRILLIVLVIVAAGGYVFFRGSQEIAAQVEFTGQGADILLNLPQEVATVTVTNEAGRLLSVITVGPGARQKIPVFIKWEPDKQYAFELALRDGRGVRLTGRTPADELEKVSFVLQAPYGLSRTDSTGVVPAGSAFTANILLTSHTDQPVNVLLDLVIPPGVEVLSVPQGMQAEQRGGVQHIVGRRRLAAINEHWNEQIVLKAAQEGLEPVIQAVANIDNGREQWQMTGHAAVKVATVADIARNIRVQAVEVPVDVTGRSDPKARSGSLVYAPASRLSSL
ncbi:MAG: hypothetical protein AAGU32_14160, partial [Bacillota bacterium]